jgi:predicted 3-demethylubiquinone-9 3-methyltransferase (glyoxalase superfamily)
MTNSIYNCLWFDGQAQDAATFYCSVFKDGKIISSNSLVVIFEINKTRFMGLNGGPAYKPSDAISFVVECEDQEEIDHHWNMLTANGGQENMCGWLKDKFGFSWQIIPKNIHMLISNPKSMEALVKMKKINIKGLEEA